MENVFLKLTNDELGRNSKNGKAGTLMASFGRNDVVLLTTKSLINGAIPRSWVQAPSLGDKIYRGKDKKVTKAIAENSKKFLEYLDALLKKNAKQAKKKQA